MSMTFGWRNFPMAFFWETLDGTFTAITYTCNSNVRSVTYGCSFGYPVSFSLSLSD